MKDYRFSDNVHFSSRFMYALVTAPRRYCVQGAANRRGVRCAPIQPTLRFGKENNLKRITHHSTRIALLAFAILSVARPARADQHIGINVLLKSAPTDALLADLGTHGTVLDVIPEIKAVTLNTDASE